MECGIVIGKLFKFTSSAYVPRHSWEIKCRIKAKTLNVIEMENISSTVRSPFLGSVGRCIARSNELILESQWLNTTQVYFLLVQTPVSIRSLSRTLGNNLLQLRADHLPHGFQVVKAGEENEGSCVSF